MTSGPPPRPPGQHIALTGAGGAIGSALIPHLSAAGNRVTALTRTKAPLPDISWYQPDDPPDLLLHLAAGTAARDQTAAEDQARPHLDMARALAGASWRGHLVFFSSAAVYAGSDQPIPETTAPAPVTAYGAAKLAVEQGLRQLARQTGLPLTVLRLANIYGSDQDEHRRRVTGLLIGAARAARPFTVFGDGSSQRDYLHIQDLCRAVLSLIRQPAPARPQLLNLGSGTGTSLERLISLTEEATGTRIQREFVPAQTEVTANVLDIRRAAKALSWTPQIPLDEGLRRLAATLPPSDDPPGTGSPQPGGGPVPQLSD